MCTRCVWLECFSLCSCRNDERLALKTVENRSIVRLRSRLGLQPPPVEGSAPRVCPELLSPSSSSQRPTLAALNAITSHSGQAPLHFRHADQRSSMFGEPDAAPARTGHDSRVVVRGCGQEFAGALGSHTLRISARWKSCMKIAIGR